MAGKRCDPGCDCRRHKGQGRKVGRKRSDSPGIVARHDRVRYERGWASDYACVRCGEQGKDWAQVHGTSGLDPFDYHSMCRRCHILYDNPGMTMPEIMRAKRAMRGGGA